MPEAVSERPGTENVAAASRDAFARWVNDAPEGRAFGQVMRHRIAKRFQPFGCRAQTIRPADVSYLSMAEPVQMCNRFVNPGLVIDDDIAHADASRADVEKDDRHMATRQFVN